MPFLVFLILVPTIIEGLPYHDFDAIRTTETTGDLQHNLKDMDWFDISEDYQDDNNDRNEYDIVKDNNRNEYDTVKGNNRNEYDIVKDNNRNEYDTVKGNNRNEYDTVKGNNRNEYDTVKANNRNEYDIVKDNNKNEYDTVKGNNRNEYDIVKDNNRNEYDIEKENDKNEYGVEKGNDTNGDSNFIIPITKPNEYDRRRATSSSYKDDKLSSNGTTDGYGNRENVATPSPEEDNIQTTRKSNTNTVTKNGGYVAKGNQHHYNHTHREHHLDEKAVEMGEPLNATIKPTITYDTVTTVQALASPTEKNEEQFLVNTPQSTSTSSSDEEFRATSAENKITEEMSRDVKLTTTSSTRARNDGNESQDRRRKEEDEEGGRRLDARNSERGKGDKYERRRDDDGDDDDDRKNKDDDSRGNRRNKDDNSRGNRNNRNNNRNKDREEESDVSRRSEKEERSNKATARPPIECEKRDLCGRRRNRKMKYYDGDDDEEESRDIRSKGYFQHPNDASYFYTCQHGVPSCLPCPTSSLSFSEKCQMCMESDNDEFCPTTKPVVTKSIDEVERSCNKEFCLGKGNGHFSNREEKHQFYMCSNGITYCMDCPEGLTFDEKCVRCVGAGDVGKKCEE